MTSRFKFGRFQGWKKSLIVLIFTSLFIGCIIHLLGNKSLKKIATRGKADIDDFVTTVENEKNLVDDEKRRNQLCPQTARSAANERVNIIVFGHGRSGTSFLGQLFNQNPSVFYHFEPFKAVEGMGQRRIDLLSYTSTQSREYIENAIGVLSAIFRCDFSESKIMSRFLTLYSKASFLRNQSAALRKLKSLYYLASEKMNELCRKRPNFTVVKLLIPRLPGGKITSLLPLMPMLNQSRFKLIHIIRDPRGTISSQASLGWFENSTFPRAANTICKQTRENLEAEKSQDQFFQCNYKRVMYERLVTKPLKVAQEIYRFIGMKASPEVEKWIARVTNSTREDLEKGETRPFSQIKDTALVMTNWKSASRAWLDIVEKECDDVMRKVGYKKLV